VKRKFVVWGCCAALAVVVGCGSKDEQKSTDKQKEAEAAKIPVEEQAKRLFGQLQDVYVSKGLSELKAKGLVTTLRLALATEVKKQNVPDAIRATLIYDHGVEPCIAGSREFRVFRQYINARRVKGEFDENQRDFLRRLTCESADVQQKVADQLEKMLER